MEVKKMENLKEKNVPDEDSMHEMEKAVIDLTCIIGTPIFMK